MCIWVSDEVYVNQGAPYQRLESLQGNHRVYLLYDGLYIIACADRTITSSANPAPTNIASHVPLWSLISSAPFTKYRNVRPSKKNTSLALFMIHPLCGLGHHIPRSEHHNRANHNRGTATCLL